MLPTPINSFSPPTVQRTPSPWSPTRRTGRERARVPAGHRLTHPGGKLSDCAARRTAAAGAVASASKAGAVASLLSQDGSSFGMTRDRARSDAIEMHGPGEKVPQASCPRGRRRRSPLAPRACTRRGLGRRAFSSRWSRFDRVRLARRASSLPRLMLRGGLVRVSRPLGSFLGTPSQTGHSEPRRERPTPRSAVEAGGCEGRAPRSNPSPPARLFRVTHGKAALPARHAGFARAFVEA
jgi:hypothetical protein